MTAARSERRSVIELADPVDLRPREWIAHAAMLWFADAAFDEAASCSAGAWSSRCESGEDRPQIEGGMLSGSSDQKWRPCRHSLQGGIRTEDDVSTREIEVEISRGAIEARR